jgi:hypothetical protein
LNSGYHQILIHLEDEEKKSFVTDIRMLYYKVMPFELKNLGATYQKTTDQVFKDQLERNIKSYMQDILSKMHEF